MPILGQGDSAIVLLNLEFKVDSIVENGILNEAFPGCIVYAARGENVLLKKSYGFHTYDSLRPVFISDIYDLASVTKILASTLAIMKLYDEDLIVLDAPLKQYVKGLGLRKIRNLTIRKCLSHEAGLQSWIPYYKEWRKENGAFKRNTISNNYSDKFPYQIAPDLYLHRDIYQKIKRMIKKATVQKSPEYLYSGLFFYLVPEIVENITNMSIDDYLRKNFYLPLNLSTTLYDPVNKFDLNRIVPTEIDTFFRNEPIHGKVHDEGAILMKGVSGNAGLFSSINDLEILSKMLLNNGSYGGKEYLKPGTINLFTSYQNPQNENRRGLGFDKPLLEYDERLSSVAKSASIYSYGHTGYTGTLFWVDPKSEVVFIFLSNRVYPNRTHKALYQLNIRPTIHQLIYDYLGLSNGF